MQGPTRLQGTSKVVWKSLLPCSVFCVCSFCVVTMCIMSSLFLRYFHLGRLRGRANLEWHVFCVCSFRVVSMCIMRSLFLRYLHTWKVAREGEGREHRRVGLNTFASVAMSICLFHVDVSHSIDDAMCPSLLAKYLQSLIRNIWHNSTFLGRVLTDLSFYRQAVAHVHLSSPTVIGLRYGFGKSLVVLRCPLLWDILAQPG